MVIRNNTTIKSYKLILTYRKKILLKVENKNGEKTCAKSFDEEDR